ncbi:MAG: glycosyltransferase family 9 protein [Spirochaetes bacterium]|nr:glycosyltransferase family 9 protein [Spirochaetota bacterium]
MKKVLIIRFSSLGDVVLVHPVIKKLHDKGYTVDLLTKKKYKEIFQYNPYVNTVFCLEEHRNLLSLAIALKKEKYFRVLDLHKNLRSAFIKLFFFLKSVTYKKFRMRRMLLVRFKINLLKNNSVIRNYMNVLKKLDVPFNEKDFSYRVFFKADKKSKYKTGKRSIVAAPFARHFTKEWANYKELLEKLQKRNHIFIIGEKKDHRRADEFNLTNATNLCGKLNFNEVLVLIDKSLLLITNDSGIMHLGAGTDTPIITVFGSTVKEFGFFLPGNKMVLMENRGLKCRPCHYHGLKRCPKGHFLCMRQISVEGVLKNVSKFI